MRAGHPAVTSHAPVGSYYSSGAAAGQQLKLTSYHVTGGTAAAAADADNDYYKSSWRRRNLASYDDVTAGVCCYDDHDQQVQSYVEHIYESPKFDTRHSIVS